MPIYEYECSKCGRIFEELQGFSDPPRKRCKFCRGKVQRLISQSSFHLKGSGWYTTDYVKGPEIPPKAAEQNNPALTDSKDGDISETKPKTTAKKESKAKEDVKSSATA